MRVTGHLAGGQTLDLVCTGAGGLDTLVGDHMTRHLVARVGSVADVAPGCGQTELANLGFDSWSCTQEQQERQHFRINIQL